MLQQTSGCASIHATTDKRLRQHPRYNRQAAVPASTLQQTSGCASIHATTDKRLRQHPRYNRQAAAPVSMLQQIPSPPLTVRSEQATIFMLPAGHNHLNHHQLFPKFRIGPSVLSKYRKNNNKNKSLSTANVCVRKNQWQWKDTVLVQKSHHRVERA